MSLQKLQEILNSSTDTRSSLGPSARNIDKVVLERSHQVLVVFIEHAVSVQAGTIETLKKAMQAAQIQDGQTEDSLSKRSMMEFKLWQILNFTYENHARIGLDCPGLAVSLRVLTWCVAAHNLLSKNERAADIADIEERRKDLIKQAKLMQLQSAALTGDVEQGNTVKVCIHVNFNMPV